MPHPSRPKLTSRPYARSSADFRNQRFQKRSPLILILLLLVWSLCLGWGLAQTTTASVQPEQVAQVSAPGNQQMSNQSASGTVDPVSQRYQLGQEVYIESCGSCHVALPPAVLPIETWQRLLQDSQHYGQQLKLLVDPPRLLVWNYLQVYSRPQAVDEKTPYRLKDSRYLKALHPKVNLPKPVTVGSCLTCHPAAAQFDFRTLSPQWRDSP
jgi:hypothetical protein